MIKIPIVGVELDERFLNHRLRSTSFAGVAGGMVAALLFAYRFYIKGVWSWDLLVVMATILSVKYSLLIWYRLRD